MDDNGVPIRYGSFPDVESSEHVTDDSRCHFCDAPMSDGDRFVFHVEMARWHERFILEQAPEWMRAGGTLPKCKVCRTATRPEEDWGATDATHGQQVLTRGLIAYIAITFVMILFRWLFH